MKKSAYSEQREMIVAEAINPIATELRLLDPADLISLLRFECYGSIADLVSSAAELYYHPGTINFGAGGAEAPEAPEAPDSIFSIILNIFNIHLSLITYIIWSDWMQLQRMDLLVLSDR